MVASRSSLAVSEVALLGVGEALCVILQVLGQRPREVPVEALLQDTVDDGPHQAAPLLGDAQWSRPLDLVDHVVDLGDEGGAHSACVCV